MALSYNRVSGGCQNSGTDVPSDEQEHRQGCMPFLGFWRCHLMGCLTVRSVHLKGRCHFVVTSQGSGSKSNGRGIFVLCRSRVNDISEGSGGQLRAKTNVPDKEVTASLEEHELMPTLPVQPPGLGQRSADMGQGVKSRGLIICGGRRAISEMGSGGK